MSSLKKEIENALLRADFEEITAISLTDKRVFRILISFAYDRKDLMCWRAIEAIGKAAGEVAKKDSVAVRNIVHRLLWSIRDESGGIGWSAPEMLGEIVRNSPDVFADIPPIIVSFQDENLFLPGILRAIGRISDTGIKQISGANDIIVKGLGHDDPEIKGIALWAASKLNVTDAERRIAEMTNDTGRFKFYEHHELREMTVGEMAKRAKNTMYFNTFGV